jgi:hypothetical protein
MVGTDTYAALLTLHETEDADGTVRTWMAAQPQVMPSGTDRFIDIPVGKIPRGILPLGDVPIRDKDIEELTILSSLRGLTTKRQMAEQVERIIVAWQEGCEKLQDEFDSYSPEVIRFRGVSSS